MAKICDIEVSLYNEKEHFFCHTLLVDIGKLNYPKNLLNATIEYVLPTESFNVPFEQRKSIIIP